MSVGSVAWSRAAIRWCGGGAVRGRAAGAWSHTVVELVEGLELELLECSNNSDQHCSQAGAVTGQARGHQR